MNSHPDDAVTEIGELSEDVTGQQVTEDPIQQRTRTILVAYGVWSTMNSSPPPPSFTLPPLTSKGRLPITPSPTPTPNEDGSFTFDRPTRQDKGKGKATEVYEVDEAQGRVSMYVRLFEGEPRRGPSAGLVQWGPERSQLTPRNDPYGAWI